MNIDIRLSLEFFDHPKTKKLKKRLGLEGVISLLKLWTWTAGNRTNGILSGMDVESIELAADWSGEEGKLIEVLLEIKLLEQCGSTYAIHDWEENQAYASKSDERKENAKKAANARWGKERECKEHKEKSELHCTDNANSMLSACTTHADVCKSYAVSNAPETKYQIPGIKENTPPIPPQGGTLADIPADDPSTLSEICDADGYAEPAGYDGTSPSIEFQEIREAYNASGRIEPPMAGHKEYAALRKTMRWPGMSAIFTAIDRFSADDCQWKEGKIPGLGRFLAEEWWRMPPRAAPAVRDEPRATTVRQKQEQDFDKLVQWAMQDDRRKYAQRDGNGQIADTASKQLPAG